MTEDQVRALLRKEIGDGSANAWCDRRGVSRPRVSEFLKGKRAPSADILDALGLEYRILRKRQTPAQDLGRAGGLARAKNLSPERRAAIARKAAETRWGKTSESEAT